VTPAHGRAVAVLVGLAEEAALVRNAAKTWDRAPAIAIGGGTPEGAGAALPALLAREPEALLSIGYAGGLDPALRPGALLIPETVTDADGTPLPCDATLVHALTDRARRRGLHPRGGAVATAALPAATPDDKRRLAEATGAVAVDLESAEAARAAAAAGVPFAAVRAVLDDARTALPPLALAAVDTATGRPRIGRLLIGVLGSPGQLPALLGLAKANAAAKASLRRLLVGPLVL
jgi:adenosylhomocysteine nucleosidase